MYTKEEKRTRHNAYMKEYRRKNLEKVRAIDRRTYERNKDRKAQMVYLRNKKWRLENPEKSKQSTSRWYNKNKIFFKINRGLRKKAPGIATMEQVEARISVFGNRCWVCKGHADSLDHVKPINKKGSNWPANLRPICKHCNCSKQDKWPFTSVIPLFQFH